MIQHLTVRVPWHDSRWNGRVCKAPSANPYCLDLERIREKRDDAEQDLVAGQEFGKLSFDQLPPCIAEQGAFMNEGEWRRRVEHPYQTLKKTADTHGQLRPTIIKVPAFHTFAIPFRWMLRDNAEEIEAKVARSLPPDEAPPFPSPWVFTAERQEAISNLFFDQLSPGTSLVFFYTKSGQPIDEKISRLIVGCGRIVSISPIQWYESNAKKSFPLWDRLFSHSIRPDGHDGLLLPYHDYLEPTGDPDEDNRRRELLATIAATPAADQVATFSYAGELASADHALSALAAILNALRLVKEHGIATGAWERREEWLNAQIAATWQQRGAFPGAGAALEALGMRLGTALLFDLFASGDLKPEDDPWPFFDALLRGRRKVPRQVYAADIKAVGPTWASLSGERKDLLTLLSRFALTPEQAQRWFDRKERNRSTRADVDDETILDNPYRIVEADLGDAFEQPVSAGLIDRGVLPDPTIRSRHPLPARSAVESQLDPRRVRATLTSVLRCAAREGDSLLSVPEAISAVGKVQLAHPCGVSADWVKGNVKFLEAEFVQLNLGNPDKPAENIPCLQLADLREREKRLASILTKRAERSIDSLKEDWPALLRAAITETAGEVKDDDRHEAALAEQGAALERVTTRRVGVLVGRAGTGKTTVLGALLKSERLAKEGILFLAPTGKSRVRITQKTNQTAMTVAQFLYRLKRYDGARQRPLFDGEEQYRQEKTVVIDECSMLTLDDLMAVLAALDLGHVQRLILVGDPNQLPPIGVGRPFADFVAHLDAAADRGDDVGKALARLGIELRTVAGGPSDALRLASWYTREAQPVDADRVLSDLETGGTFNDLSVVFWRTPEDLRRRLDEQMIQTLGLATPADVQGFNAALGLTKEGWVPFDDHNGAERFQILSPVRLHPYGVAELNKLVQRRFRAPQLKTSREPWGVSLGDEEIVWGDKVIMLRNTKRDGWNGKTKQAVEEYLANGEIGIAAPAQGGAKIKGLNVAFAGRPDVRFGFWKNNFKAGEGGPLELAYALTVHKAQGSEFRKVFVVIPKNCRPMSRELVYTALTRARDHLVLFVEGDNASFLYDLTKPERSEVARRNSNLFAPGIRHEADGVPFAEHLIHRTSRGELVRSKSELAIANHLFNQKLKYHYERPLEGSAAPGRLRPDFSFVDDAGDVILWEHLGMLHRAEYRKAWEWKRNWYLQNGFREGVNLFTTSEVDGLDMRAVEGVTESIRAALGL